MSSFVGSVPILAVVTIHLLLLRSVCSLNLTNEYLHHECFNSQGKYKKGSPFEDNVNRVVRSISIGNLRDGFGDSSHGEGPNNVYVRLQCRADSYWSNCHPCLATAVSGLRRRCPGNKGAIIWYDQCLLRISTVHAYGKVDYQNKFFMSSPNKVSGNPQSFNQETSALLEKLTLKASDTKNFDGDSLVLYASGEMNLGTKNLYAMVQCTKDLVFNSCLACLKWILKDFPKCCDGKSGGRVLSTSCNFRYEVYPFLRTLKTV